MRVYFYTLYTFALTTASTSRFHSYPEETSRSVYCFLPLMGCPSRAVRMAGVPPIGS